MPSIVFQADQQGPGLFFIFNPDGDQAVIMGKLNGIGDEVGNDLNEFYFINVNINGGIRSN
jgi:hypothetical protein